MNYLYVCHFSNGHIKVGRSINPMARIASHEDRVSCLGVELVEYRIFECVGHVVPAEAELIRRCGEVASKTNKNEWFEGLDFIQAIDMAHEISRLQFEPVARPKIQRADDSIKQALNEAAAKVGGLANLAIKVGAPSYYAAKQWRISGVPAEYCPAIEAATGVRCERLCPSVEWFVLRNTQPEAA